MTPCRCGPVPSPRGRGSDMRRIDAVWERRPRRDRACSSRFAKRPDPHTEQTQALIEWYPLEQLPGGLSYG